MSIYDEDLAYVHHVGFAALIEGAAPALLGLLRQAGFEAGTVVDLACGGGLWAKQLLDAGYDVLGVDVSASMVELARETAPAAEFRCGSLWTTELPRCVGVTVLGEGLNYASQEEPDEAALHGFFARVREALEPGGVFVADVIVQADEPRLDAKTWRAGEGWAVLVDAEETPDPATLTRDIVVFREHESAWRRSTERHVVRVFDAERVATAMERAGLRVERSASYGAHALLPRRQAFVAQRV